MTQQLLDLASTENEPELLNEKIDLVSFCKDCTDMLRNLYQREIEVLSTSTEMFLWADPLKIKQLLLILLDNALKYSSRVIQVILSEKAAANGERFGVEIRVKDQG